MSSRPVFHMPLGDLSNEREHLLLAATQEFSLAIRNYRNSAAVATDLLYTAMGLFGSDCGAVYLMNFRKENNCLQLSTSEGGGFPEELPGKIRRKSSEMWEKSLVAHYQKGNKEETWNSLFPKLMQGGTIALLAGNEEEHGLLCLGPSRTGLEWESGPKSWLGRLCRIAGAELERIELAGQLIRLREELDRKVLQLVTLFETGREIHSFANWDLLTKNILFSAMGNLGVREGGLLAPKAPEPAFQVWQSRGLRPERMVERFELENSDPLLEYLNSQRRAILRKEIKEKFEKHPILHLAFEVLIPGVGEKNCEFLLLLGNKLNRTAYSPDELEYLSILCSQAAVVFENRELVRQNIQSERLAAIGQALAGLSHDFRGVLNGLSGASRHLAKMVEQITAGEAVDGERLRRWWSVIRANEKRLNDLVEEIVEYSKPRPAVREPCQINKLVQELAEQKEEPLKQSRIGLRLDLGASIPEVKADPTRVYRALNNLVDNAADAVMPGKGKIEIRTRMQLDAVFLEVRDNGSGIESRHLPLLFDPLFSTKKGSKGTGFGLANVKKIAEEHGGRIEVESQPGHGSVFRLGIPIRDSSRLLEAGTRQMILEEKETE